MKRTRTHSSKDDFIESAGTELTACLKDSVLHVKNHLSEPLTAEQGDIVSLVDLSVTTTFVKPPSWVYSEEDLKYPLIDFGWGHFPGTYIFTNEM